MPGHRIGRALIVSCSFLFKENTAMYEDILVYIVQVVGGRSIYLYVYIESDLQSMYMDIDT